MAEECDQCKATIAKCDGCGRLFLRRRAVITSAGTFMPECVSTS